MIAALISSDPRFEIVGKLDGMSDLWSTIRQTRAEVVIAQEREDIDAVNQTALLVAKSCTQVLAIHEGARSAEIYQLRLQRTALREISADDLISAISLMAGQ